MSSDPFVRNRNFGLDVARFIAVSLVLLPHCGIIFAHLYGKELPAALSYSAVFGVELFFVLSGFLIGRILLRIIATGPDWRAWLIFMTRRWMRTLPLYYAWLLVLALVLPLPAHFGAHLLHYATMTQNLAWPMPRDGWFSVSWSLTIEEWFYLLFSGALVASAALTRSERCIWPVIALFVIPPFVARYMSAPLNYEADIYHVVLLRLDAIAYGVALAKLWQDRSRLFQYPRLAAALGGILIAGIWTQSMGYFLPIPPQVYFQLYLPATWIGCCLCLVGAVRLEWEFGWIGRLISTGSQISYGIYITHLTILEATVWYGTAHGLRPIQTVLIATVLMAVVPYASFRFFELPILALRPRERRPVRPIIGPNTMPNAPDFAPAGVGRHPPPAHGVALATSKEGAASVL
jgi:peptidoglycan/LPS O-acetylase OafA/YrhL